MAVAFFVFLVVCLVIGACAGADDSKKRAQKRDEERQIRELILKQNDSGWKR